MTLEVIDLPRSAYKVLPPRRWQVALTLAVVILTAAAWSLL